MVGDGQGSLAYCNPWGRKESDMTEQLNWTARRSNQSILKEIKPEYSFRRADTEAPILWPPDMKSRLIGKDPDAGKDRRQEKNGTTEGQMVRWHH